VQLEPAVERLAALLAVPTVSRADPDDTDWGAFDRFRAVLAARFPRVFSALDVELVAGHTLLARWAGADPAAAPVVLMAHQDVVDPGDTSAWPHPAFGGRTVGEGAERALWGRGAIDDKGSLAGILEAVDGALAEGRRPSRDVWLVFGHDEETAGSGAAAAAGELERRGVRPAFVLDEGGAIVEGFLPGVDAPLAAVGLSEKGIVTIRLSVEEAGGHASTPPRVSAIGRLARAIARMDARPFPARLTATTRAMFRAAGSRAKGALGWVYRHPGVCAPLLLAALRRSGPEGDAMTRTTRVATMIEGGHARNAIPERASAIVNLRVIPGSSVEAAIEHLCSAIDDPRVRIETLQAAEPAPVSPTSGFGWDVIRATLAEVRPDAVLTPYTQNGATDSRHFTRIADAVYRFTPFDLTDAERAALHAVGERIRVDAYLRGVEFYRALVARL